MNDFFKIIIFRIIIINWLKRRYFFNRGNIFILYDSVLISIYLKT